jgi:DNA-binding GntR family transcriptional regulator
MNDLALTRHGGNSAAQEAAAQLRGAITSGALQPGERIKENLVAEQMGISRGPVREALRILGGEGLVILRPNRGAEVRRVTAVDVLEIYALREPLGAVAIRDSAAAVQAGSDMAPQIVESVRALRARELAHLAAAEGGTVGFVDADLSVQAAIVALGRLPRTSRKFDELTTEIRGLIHDIPIDYSDVAAAVAKYESILDDIERGDVDGALSRWRAHIAAASGEFLATLEGADAARSSRPGILPI